MLSGWNEVGSKAGYLLIVRRAVSKYKPVTVWWRGKKKDAWPHL